MQTLLFVTGNVNKIKEVRAILGDRFTVLGKVGGILSEWNSNRMESSSSFGNVGKLFDNPGCLSETSRSSGLLVTVPELVRDIAPMRYGLLADEFYKSGTNTETVLNIENEQSVPSSSLSKVLISDDDDDDDKIRPVSCQCESFYMKDKLCPSQDSAKFIGKENSLLSTLFDKEEGVSECRWETSKIREVPVWKPTSKLFCDRERKCKRNDSAFPGRGVHRVIFSPAPEKDPLFGRKNHISAVSLAYRPVSRTSTFFDRFRCRRILRATAHRFLIDRDPKYKIKYD
ncbi:hypothetical protein ACH3XW_3215 [Acanthocheilonema viteae]